MDMGPPPSQHWTRAKGLTQHSDDSDPIQPVTFPKKFQNFVSTPWIFST